MHAQAQTPLTSMVMNETWKSAEKMEKKKSVSLSQTLILLFLVN